MSTASGYFEFYPNPVNDYVQIYTKSALADEVKRVWIKPARLDESVDDSYLNLNIPVEIFF